MVCNMWDDAEYICIRIITDEYVINDIINDANIIIPTVNIDKSNK